MNQKLPEYANATYNLRSEGGYIVLTSITEFYQWYRAFVANAFQGYKYGYTQRMGKL